MTLYVAMGCVVMCMVQQRDKYVLGGGVAVQRACCAVPRHAMSWCGVTVRGVFCCGFCVRFVLSTVLLQK